MQIEAHLFHLRMNETMLLCISELSEQYFSIFSGTAGCHFDSGELLANTKGGGKVLGERTGHIAHTLCSLITFFEVCSMSNAHNWVKCN